MKFTLNLIVLLSLFVFAKAQKPVENTLPFDERGKYIYYEVVDTKVAKDSLKVKALHYVKKENKALKFKTAIGDTAFMASGKLVISKTLLVMSHPSGEVLYNFQVEVKKGKYRFWLTDFEFIPYQRDRYGNFVASTSIGIPLEHNPGKLNAGEWAAYKAQTAKYAQELALKFKNYMVGKMPVIAPPAEKKVIKKDW